MKYIKLFEDFKINNSYFRLISESDFEIIDLNKGIIHFKGDVNLGKFDGDKLPFDFSNCIVDGSFRLSNNKINNLVGLPKKIGKSLYANGCDLNSLEGISEYIGRDLILNKNFIKNLEIFPKYVGGSIYLGQNDIKTLEGLSSDFKGELHLEQNPYLISLKGCPGTLDYLDIRFTKIYSFEGFPTNILGGLSIDNCIKCDDTPIYKIIKLIILNNNITSYNELYSKIDYLNDMGLLEERLDPSSKPRIRRKNLIRIFNDLDIELTINDLESISVDYDLY